MEDAAVTATRKGRFVVTDPKVPQNVNVGRFRLIPQGGKILLNKIGYFLIY